MEKEMSEAGTLGQGRNETGTLGRGGNVTGTLGRGRNETGTLGRGGNETGTPRQQGRAFHELCFSQMKLLIFIIFTIFHCSVEEPF